VILVMVVSLLVVVVMIVTAFGTFVFDERRGSKRVLESVEGELTLKSGLECSIK
jgi:hypothetical protein